MICKTNIHKTVIEMKKNLFLPILCLALFLVSCGSSSSKNEKEKIAEDCQWDGLKGYITNTDLDTERVIAEYHGLWVVERAFRVSKGTLEMRPMFHFTEH